MTAIKMIPISRVRVLNPRARAKGKFSDIVANIAAIGLKKPITIAPREEDPGTYDLVCGQGRLEAFQVLGQGEVPAIVRPLPRVECLIQSLVENLCRRRPHARDLVREVRRLRDSGYSNTEIGAKVDKGETYVTMLLRLVDHGEDRLLRAVERGEIPIVAAVQIAGTDDAAIQEILEEAYKSKQLRGKELTTARRLVDERQARGKRISKNDGPRKPKLTAEELLRRHRKEVARQRRIAKKARHAELRLVFLSNALKRLLGDEHFVTLLRAEKLDTMPEYLAAAVKGAA